MTDKKSAALRAQTGRDYAEWFAAMDEWGAPGRPFRDIAAWLTGQGMSGWWAQKLIVEYEQARGIRKPGARPDGTFSGGASKTIAAPVTAAFEAFTDAELRQRWLPGLTLHERTSKRARSARFDATDGSILSVTFEPRGDRKCVVAVEQTKLPDAAAADRAKALWSERLTAFKSAAESRT